MQIAAAAAQDMLNALISNIGASPKLRIRSGAAPANIAASSTGAVLAEITLGSTWATASGFTLSFSNLPLVDASADASGAAGHWELVTSGGTRKLQGSVGLAVDNPDMELSSMTLVGGASFSVLAASIPFDNQ